jgi:hypothetical protein
MLSVIIKENSFESNIFLETLLNSEVEFLNCLINNNILTTTATSKQQNSLFKLVASIKIINSIFENNILRETTLLLVTVTAGDIGTYLEISSSEFNQNTGSHPEPLLLLANGKNLKVIIYKNCEFLLKIKIYQFPMKGYFILNRNGIIFKK